eukprot:m51a1_g984 hypothetical protein (696) ;mRNA; r:445321-461472
MRCVVVQYTGSEDPVTVSVAEGSDGSQLKTAIGQTLTALGVPYAAFVLDLPPHPLLDAYVACRTAAGGREVRDVQPQRPRLGADFFDVLGSLFEDHYVKVSVLDRAPPSRALVPFPVRDFGVVLDGSEVPAAEGLREILVLGLPHKFPLRSIPPEAEVSALVHSLFETSSPYADDRLTMLASSVLYTDPAEGSVATAIPVVEAVFGCVFRRLSRKLGLNVDRSTHDASATSVGLRPGFFVQQRNALVVKGEENNNFEDAKHELVSKMVPFVTSLMGAVPYVFCYASDSSRFQLFVITRDAIDDLKPISGVYRLNNVSDRLCIFRSALNITRVLATFTVSGVFDGICNGVYRNMFRPNNVMIRFENNHVVKSWPVGLEHCDVAAVEELYNALHNEHHSAGAIRFGRPLCNVVHPMGEPTLRISKDRNFLSVRLQPICHPTRRPHSVHELARCARDTLSGLSVIHKLGYIHCDVRAPNVLYDEAAECWVLIDLEYARRPGSLVNWSHETMDPEIKEGKKGPLCNVVHPMGEPTLRISKDRNFLSVRLQPICHPTRRPHSVHELARCARDTLSGLSVIHKLGYIHCDVRAPNVLYDEAAECWVLIDLEYARRPGSLVNWSHETMDPEIKEGKKGPVRRGAAVPAHPEATQPDRVVEPPLLTQTLSGQRGDVVNINVIVPQTEPGRTNVSAHFAEVSNT